MTGRRTQETSSREAAASARRDAARARPYRLFARLFQVWLFVLCALAAGGAAAARPLRVLGFGDSLTAGYLLPADAAFPAQLEKRLRADGFDAAVVNAGVSGDTSAGGRERIAFSLQDGADLVILELGANDMLRGLDPKATRDNLEKIIADCRAAGARVLLAGMVASGNFGPDYKKAFDAIYPELAARRGLPLYPFFLEGVSGDKMLSLADGLHPNAQGVARIVNGIAPLVEASLTQIRVERAKAGGGR